MNEREIEQLHRGSSQRSPLHRCCVALAAVLLSTACTTRVTQPAPVDDRSGQSASGKELAANPLAGKEGYYTVKPGDTLYRIALESGQSWRDVQAWNNLSNVNLLEVGQVLRVAPPGAQLGAVSAAAAAASAGVGAPATSAVTNPNIVSRPLPPPPSGAAGTPPVAAGNPATAPGAAALPNTPPVASASATDEASVLPAGTDAIALVWPAQGAVIAGFDESKNKGVGIAGRVGEAVMAAADGRVVYAGAGLRGYGNLIILKHNDTFLTAYAHNQALLVREDQAVRQGQKIAEMGSSDADRVKLHFEVRLKGKPVNPLAYLPKR